MYAQTLPRLRHALQHPFSRLTTQGRVVVAILFSLLGVYALAASQALNIARQDIQTAFHTQASAQLATLSQAVSDSAIVGDLPAMQAQLKSLLAQGNLRYVEFIAPNGYTLREEARARLADRPEWFAEQVRLDIPALRRDIVFGDKIYGQLLIKPSARAYEDLLWHLAAHQVLLLGAAFALVAWLTLVLLKINLKDLGLLRAAARRIEAGDYGARIPIRPGSPPELRETLHAFNYMGAALERLLDDLSQQKIALDHSAAVAESDLAGTITYVNDLFCTSSGYAREELLGQNYRILNSGRHDTAFFTDLWDTLASGRSWRGELCNRGKDGQLFWMESTIIPVMGDDGLPQKYLSIRFDTTRRKRDEAALDQEKRRWQVTLASINDAVIVTDPQHQVTYLNASAESLLGTTIEEAMAHPLEQLMQFDQWSGDDDAPTCPLVSGAAPLNQTGSAQLRTRQGRKLAVSYSCAPLGGGDAGTVYVLRDEVEKKQLLDSLREMAYHDTLTALPNRRAVEGRLERALRTARDHGQNHAFCFIDLDQFKLVNDTCGHAVGDILLVNVAQTMQATLPEQAYLGRLGGDEFGLILFDTQLDEADWICRQLVQRIRNFRFEHNGRGFPIGACVGITPISHAVTAASDLLIQADMACYRAKSEGSGRVVRYQADEVGFRRLETEMGWAADFARALEGNQFLPYRQLIQPTSAQGHAHYEVLIRWQRNGVIEGPAKLLPALERYGQAPILDRWMVEAVISYLAAHADDEAVYFVNLSGKTVADAGFLDTVCRLLDHYGVPGIRLGFEVTETSAVVNLADAQRLIEGLRARGCQFALDDFGRDASSFFYLKHLPADYLKIDGAFVRGMLDDRRDQVIVRSIAQLARDFGMRSVAEQVEDAEMAAMLVEIGVDYLQGYHLHRPEAFPHWQPFTPWQPAAPMPPTPVLPAQPDALPQPVPASHYH